MKKNKVLIIGQTPPPYGGQALMLKTLLEGKYEKAELFHVRLDFSKDFHDMGSFKFYKIWAMIKTVFLTWVYRFYYSIDTVYYGPAGPNKVAIIRDILILLPTRFLFKNTILHTHAGGSSILYKSSGFIFKFFYRITFFKPDILITLTDFSHGDDIILKPRKKVVVSNGIKDEFIRFKDKKKANSEIISILYVGAIYEERGVTHLIEAAHLLKQEGFKFSIKIVGIFISNEYRLKINNLIELYGLNEEIVFLGTKINDEKWKIYFETDIFCFPTFVPSETFGIVLVESMQFNVSIVASRWNGIPNLVNHGYNGLLFNPKDTKDLAEKIKILIKDKNLRIELGNNGRKTFLEKYTIEEFFKNMNKVFNNL